MVAGSKMTDRVDLDLHVLGSFIEDLPALVEEWPRMGDMERADNELWWDELSSRARALEESLTSGELTAEQEERYRAIKVRLSENLPHLEALRLDPPKVPLD